MNWKPKNAQELKDLYEPHMKEAFDKIAEYQKKTGKTVYVNGSGYDDYPPRKGIFLVLDSDKTDSTELSTLKQLLENDYVTIESRRIARFC